LQFETTDLSEKNNNSDINETIITENRAFLEILFLNNLSLAKDYYPSNLNL